MLTHNWQSAMFEVTQQILHSSQFSKAELKLGPLLQEYAEIQASLEIKVSFRRA
jgi:hypothetical protein